jgi:hypothetical protein
MQIKKLAMQKDSRPAEHQGRFLLGGKYLWWEAAQLKSLVPLLWKSLSWLLPCIELVEVMIKPHSELEQ